MSFSIFPPKEAQENPVPSAKVVYNFVKYESGGSKNLALLDGSGGAITISEGPPSDEVWYVTKLTLLAADTGNFDGPEQFLSFGVALANGIDFIQSINGSAANLATLVDNEGIATNFNVNGSFISQISSSPTSRAIIGSANTQPPITLNGAVSDSLDIVINDDLTPADYIGFTLYYWRVL